MYFQQDRILSFEELIDAPLPKAPVEVGIVPHWLIINGVQPLIPENAPLEKPAKRAKTAAQQPAAAVGTVKDKERPAAAPAGKSAAASTRAAATEAAAGAGDAEGGTQVVKPLKHLVSQELQVYFDRVVGTLKGVDGVRPQPGGAAAAPQSGISTSPSLPAQQRAALSSLTTDPGAPLGPI